MVFDAPCGDVIVMHKFWSVCRQNADIAAGGVYCPSVASSVNFAAKDSTLWSQSTLAQQRRHDLGTLAQSQQISNDSSTPVRLSHINSTGYQRRVKKHKPVSRPSSTFSF